MKSSFSISRSKKYYFGSALLLFQLFLILTSCSDYGSYLDDEPTFEVLVTQAIGPDGGLISAEGINIEIPKNAFPSLVEVKISQDISGDFVDNEGLAPLFRIEGFPEKVNQAITIKISLSGTIEGIPMVGIGRKAYQVSQQAYGYPLFPLLAEVEDNQLILSLADQKKSGKNLKSQIGLPLDYSGNLNLGLNLNLGFTVTALQSMQQKESRGGHFLIHNKINKGLVIDKLDQYLEAAYDTCAKMGFDLAPRSWPMVINVTQIPGAFGQFISSALQPVEEDKDITACFNDGFIEIDEQTLTDNHELKATIIHEFLHCVQNLYEFSVELDKDQLWLMEASSVWIESKVNPDPFYVSSVLPTRAFNLFNGWQHEGDAAAIANHGYGMAPLIYGFNNAYPETGIKSVYETIKNVEISNGAVDPVDALMQSIPDPIPAFWHKVLTDYTSGKMYTLSISDILLGENKNYEKTLKINRERDFKQEVQLNMQNLSGKLIKIDIPYNPIEDIKGLVFSIEQSSTCGIAVLKYKAGEKPILLGSTIPGKSAQLVLSNIETLISNGHQLILLVSNGQTADDYLGKNTVDLTMEVSAPPEDQWEFAYQCKFWGMTSFNGADIFPSLLTFNSVIHPVMIQEENGSYSASFSFDDPITFLDVKAEGTISFEATDQEISNLQVAMSWHKVSTGFRQSESFSIGTVPLNNIDEKLRTYSRSGHNLFSNRSYVTSTNNPNVSKYEGLDPTTELSERLQESILIYLRAPHK